MGSSFGGEAGVSASFLLLSAAGLYPVSSALLIAEYAVYAALFVYGAWSGRLLHGTWWRSLVGGLFTLAVGALIGIPVPFVGPVFGAVVGAGYAWMKAEKQA